MRSIRRYHYFNFKLHSKGCKPSPATCFQKLGNILDLYFSVSLVTSQSLTQILLLFPSKYPYFHSTHQTQSSCPNQMYSVIAEKS